MQQRRLAMTGKLSEQGLHRLLTLLARDGEQALIVGGAVRNSLLGLPIDDIDIATSLEPKDVIDRLTNAGIRTIPTGLDHGTVTVLIGDYKYEVTTFREDIETDGRHATVRFGRDMQRDAERRDFTINALYADASGVVFDPVGGMEDLIARRVRFIGDPRTRIREDYLRSLRFFRFTARYSKGETDTAALTAIDAEREGLSTLSRERVRAEIFKLIDAPRAVYVLRIMAHRGLVEPIFGVPLDLDGLARMLIRDPGADALLRIAALAIHKPDDAMTLRTMLRLSNPESERLAKLGQVLMQLSALPRPLNPKEIRKLAFRVGRRATTDALVIDAGRRDVKVSSELWLAAGSAPTHTPFNGAAVIKRGIPAGPLVGNVIRHAETAWADADFPSDPESLRRLMAEAITRYAGSVQTES